MNVTQSSSESPQSRQTQQTVPVQYSAAMLEAADEEQRLSDAAETALAAVLLAVLLPGAGLTSVSPAVLEAAVSPVLLPLALQVYDIMLRQAPVSARFNDQSAATDSIRQIVRKSVAQVAEALDSKPQEPAADVYVQSTKPETWTRNLADTIVTAAVEGTKDSLAEQLGLTHGRWITRMDDRVRFSHRVLEGDTKPIGEKFKTGAGNLISRPGDRSAPISDWINCRCRVLYFRKTD